MDQARRLANFTGRLEENPRVDRPPKIRPLCCDARVVSARGRQSLSRSPSSPALHFAGGLKASSRPRGVGPPNATTGENRRPGSKPKKQAANEFVRRGG